MKVHLLLAVSSALLLTACANAQETSMNKPTPSTTGPSTEDIRAVSPGLARFVGQTIDAELWNRPGLSRRDRSVVTLTTLIARNQKDELANQIELALLNGVKPGEVSEIITHLAFYSGMGNAMSAVPAAKALMEHLERNPNVQRIAADKEAAMPTFLAMIAAKK